MTYEYLKYAFCAWHGSEWFFCSGCSWKAHVLVPQEFQLHQLHIFCDCLTLNVTINYSVKSKNDCNFTKLHTNQRPKPIDHGDHESLILVTVF